jgi:hypothetical protein
MMGYLYRMLAHTYYHHRKLFDSLEYRYRIGECLTLFYNMDPKDDVKS